MSNTTDIHYMCRALELARSGVGGVGGVGTTTPNPSVGCVLVRDDVVIGEGCTRPGGVPHAEVQALKDAGDAAGATAYVTLEPCSHHGKSPPCANALIEAGVARVVVAAGDPNPEVSGGGIEAFRAAGIEVTEGVQEAEARAVNPGFMQRMVTGKPRVVGKLAMSLDGRTAMANGESQWITGPEARADVQRLRARSCAIVTGVGSILDDDPSLNVRLDDYRGEQPLRVVMDSKLRLPADARMLSLPGQTLVYYASELNADREDRTAHIAQLRAAGAEVESLADVSGRVDLAAAMIRLGQRGCNEVLVECGSRLAGAFLQDGLLDEIVVYMAPTLLGSNARPLMELPLEHMADKVELETIDVRRVGRDWRFTMKPL